MRDRLLGETREIMLVGHMPNLPRLLRLLLAEDPDTSGVTFPLHGIVALEAVGDGWEEKWRIGS
jgi:phosphohistidine phosphatase SixA